MVRQSYFSQSRAPYIHDTILGPEVNAYSPMTSTFASQSVGHGELLQVSIAVVEVNSIRCVSSLRKGQKLVAMFRQAHVDELQISL